MKSFHRMLEGAKCVLEGAMLTVSRSLNLLTKFLPHKGEGKVNKRFLKSGVCILEKTNPCIDLSNLFIAAPALFFSSVYFCKQSPLVAITM